PADHKPSLVQRTRRGGGPAGELLEEQKLIVRQRQPEQGGQEHAPSVPGLSLEVPAKHLVVIDGADDVDGRHGEPSLAASSACTPAGSCSRVGGPPRPGRCRRRLVSTRRKVPAARW